MSAVLSEEKQTHLSHVILQCFEGTSEGRLTGSSTLALREIKRVLAEQMSWEREMDRFVRSRLQSYSKKIPEGSAEWEVLYQKTYAEELRKRQLT